MKQIHLFSMFFIISSAFITEDLKSVFGDGELNKEPYPGQISDPDDIFDDLYLEGNKFTHKERLFDYRINDKASKSPLKIESSLDYFGGLLYGHYPYYSPEVYRANVHDFNI